MYINYGEETKTSSSLILATLLHASVYAGLLFSPLSDKPEMFPEGTAPITVDFEAMDVSKGQQITAFKKSSKETETQMGSSLPELDTSPAGPDDVVIAPPPKPVKIKKRKSKPKKITQQKSKAAKPVVTQKESPVIMPIPAKKKPWEDDIKALAPSNLVDDSVFDEAELDEYEELEKEAFITDDFEEIPKEEEHAFAQEEEAISPPVVIADNKPLNESISKAQNNKQNQELPEKKPLPPAILNGSKTKMSQKHNTTPTPLANPNSLSKGSAPQGTELPTQNKVATSNKDFGLPAGTISYLNLKQRPGNVAPHYPFNARRNRWTGKTVLLYYVNDLGLVKNVQVKKSSGYQVLDNAAIQGIKRWRFYKGQPSWTIHPVNFKLQGPNKKSPSRLRLRARAR